LLITFRSLDHYTFTAPVRIPRLEKCFHWTNCPLGQPSWITILMRKFKVRLKKHSC
jgi:hypothetical protein